MSGVARKRRLVWVVALALLCSVGVGACRPRQPQILLVTIDTLRADHVGARGSLPSLTPSLDRLASDGVVYQDALCNSTMTLPSHLAMLTGLYPPRHAAREARYRLRPDVATLPGLLREHGLKTGAIVSSRVVTKRLTGLAEDFHFYDQSFSHPERNRPHLLTKPPEEAVRIARKWLIAHRDEPFFLWLHIFPPHGPYDPPARFLRDVVVTPGTAAPLPTGDRNYRRGWIPKYQRLGDERRPASYRRGYAGNVRYADHHLGRLFRALRQEALYSRMLIAVTADHGETLGERGWYFCHGNLAYAEQARVPLIVKRPGRVHAGAVVGAPVELVDLTPTLLDAAGAPSPGGLDGMTLPLPGEVPDPRPRFVQSEGAEIMALVDGPWKLVLRRPTAHLVPDDHPEQEPFRIDLDPDESRNLVRQEPRRVREMRQRLVRELRGTTARQSATDPATDPKAEEMLRALGYLD